MAAVAAVKHRQEQARLVRTYQEFCEEHAFNPRSPTLVSVGAFLLSSLYPKPERVDENDTRGNRNDTAALYTGFRSITHS